MKILIALLITINSYASITSIYSTRDGSYLSFNQLLEELPKSGFVVLGEFHNTKSIQEAQARIIKEKAILENKQSSTRIMWEFLNHTDQEKINESFNFLLSRSISTEEFVTKVAGKQNLAYIPIMEVAKEFGNAPIALNLPRELKKKVMNEGIGSIDPIFVPAHHYVGGEDYLTRFKLAMGGHAPDDMVAKYFLAQCLTDSVMSDEANKNHLNLSFIIAGSFHTDFFDGTVSRLREINSSEIISLKITSKELYDEEFIIGSDLFGQYADFILITQ
ncbi:hypothetical protein A9Q84_20150 [Halobacteriovorax marinus]|uniref:Haem-binding uptake Tiki superfamily ChaN domain-containing protein n=1 Tax=Halobacteriovorax marinus TaxID=97084 RepID=A0A1Y5F105_9BACT|nr:hypothetical protein A9Q84_20150 [Halobacteriovorax marinus]